MASSSSSEAQLKSEIARLTASINQHKLGIPTQAPNFGRNNTYVNPNYKPANKYIRPAINSVAQPAAQVHPAPLPSTQVKDVVLNGVAFESSGRSLVRKDRKSEPVPYPLWSHPPSIPTPSLSVPKPVSSGPRSNPPIPPHQGFSRKSGHLIPTNRTYKPKASRGRRGVPINRNMTLNNGRKPYQARRAANKRLKYLDKPCPRFTTTGSCSRGLTCLYQHDASKIAICWNFLQGNCPKTADTCNLSHDPTPERTPLCLHFLNKGRCTRDKCPFPHVNVGARQGVCRDFAVLGYCDKGLDCDKQHVRECPDFAEKGACSTKGCKLPHVIRANRTRKPAASTTTAMAEPPPAPGSSITSSSNGADASAGTDDTSSSEKQQQQITASQAQLGDEYISLTFHESESSEEESDDEEEDDDDDDDDVDDEEGLDPNDEA